MLNLSNISLRRGTQLLIRDASLQVHAGQRLGVIGANGSGKTSLFAMIMGKLDADNGAFSLPQNLVIAHVEQESPSAAIAAVEFVIEGDAELISLRREIAATEANGTNDALAALYEHMEHIDGYSANARAARLLHGLGFAPEDIQNPVPSFSGGWRMRLNLARALMCRSDMLLLDEPTNHLDLPAILWLERWLSSFPGILLVVSHDRDFLDVVCTRIAHIEHQEIRLYTGNYSQFEAQRAEQLAQQQSMYQRQQKDIAHIQSYVDRFRYKASKARQAQSRLKMLERMQKIAPAHADSEFRFHFLPPDKQPQHLLGLTDAALGYRESGAKVVLRDINLSLSAGDRLGLLGVNGAGKSTLVKALADGSTVLEGERNLSKDANIGYFAQHQLDLLIVADSPMDHLQRIASKDREQDMRNYLGRFGFSGERIFAPVVQFSGGEKARLVLALMIRQKPNLLLLDEPTNHLDLDMRQALSIALIEYSGALVVISHDRHLLRSVCDELVVVHGGIVEPFTRTLDEYPDWLREQSATESTAGSANDKPQTASSNRKKQRQLDASRREQLKPLRDKVLRIEEQLAIHRETLVNFERCLSETSIYSDPARKKELKEILAGQAATKSEIEKLECDWLTASETLEKAG